MILGNFVFNLKTMNPNTLTRTTEYNWSDSDRIGDIPNLQNLGTASDQIEIEGVFYPAFSGNSLLTSIGIGNSTTNGILRALTQAEEVYASVADIRNSSLCTMANVLISDNGEILGCYVITRIQETQSFFDANGKPKKVEFSLTLKRSPEESTATALISSGENSLIKTATNIARSFLRW